MISRRRHIRKLAHGLLSENKVQRAPVDVEKIAERAGAIINRRRVDGEVSGFLIRHSGHSIIGVNAAQASTRQRFTVAHELGHLLLHATAEVHVDQGFAIKLRDQESSRGLDLQEMEANLFAAELLMPSHFIEADLRRVRILDLHDEEHISELAKLYKVSGQAMTIRLGQLGAFTPHQFRSR